MTSAGCGPVTAVVVQPGKFHLSKDISRLCLFSREASGEALCGKDCGGKLPFESLIFLNRGSRRERMSLLLWERLRNRNVGQTRLKHKLFNY